MAVDHGCTHLPRAASAGEVGEVGEVGQVGEVGDLAAAMLRNELGKAKATRGATAPYYLVG